MTETGKRQHPNDPLHGVTLRAVLEHMVKRHGWHGLAREIPIRCFLFDPSVKSSLIFLRKNPWAREKLENWHMGEIRKARGHGL